MTVLVWVVRRKQREQEEGTWEPRPEGELVLPSTEKKEKHFGQREQLMQKL